MKSSLRTTDLDKWLSDFYVQSIPQGLLKNITQSRWESSVAKHRISNKPLGDAVAGVWTTLESSIWALGEFLGAPCHTSWRQLLPVWL